MPNAPLFVLFFFLKISNGLTYGFISEFCRKNGFGSLILFKESDVSEYEIQLIASELVKEYVSFRLANDLDEVYETNFKVLYVYNEDTKNLDDLLARFPVKSVAMYSLMNDSFDRNVEAVSLFYQINTDSTVDLIFKMGARDFVIKNRLRVKDAAVMEGPIDFKGLQLDAVTHEWIPHLFMNCSSDTDVCECKGYLKDVMDIMGQTMNFTWRCLKEPSGLWGIEPYPNNTWYGNLGTLHNHKSDIGLSAWRLNIQRAEYFDLVETTSMYVGGVIFMGNKDADYELFFRPFTDRTWVAICSIVLFTGLYVFVIRFQVKDFFNTVSYNTLVTTMAYFFLLLDAYYEGALTMFFTTEKTIPFDSAVDVAYSPDWDVLYTEQDYVMMKTHLTSEDKRIKEYWTEIQSNPKKFESENILDGLYRAKKEKVVYFREIPAVLHVISSNHEYLNEFKDLNVIGKKFGKNWLIFPKNSPLAASMGLYTLSLSERGFYDRTHQSWESARISPSSVELITLSGGQMSATFLILIGAMILAVITLGSEILIQKWKLNPSISK